jgi:hypothetical protein
VTDDLAFYNAGCHEPKGARRVVVPARRALRRLLRPIFQRQAELLQAICHRLDAAEAADAALRGNVDALARRQDQLADQMRETIAFGWDYVALTRRLAALEDRIAASTTPVADSSNAPPSPGRDGTAAA